MITDIIIRVSIGIGFILLLCFPDLYSQPENYRVEPIPKTAELSNITITCVLQDSEGFMWFGTESGLYRYDGVEFKIYQHDPFNPKTLSADGIVSIVEDSANTIWVATSYTLDRFNKNSECFEQIEIIEGPIRDMLDDKNGNIWLGTWKVGLMKFEKETGRLSRETTPESYDTTQRVEMRKLLMDRKGSLWIKYGVSSLCRYDPESGFYEDMKDADCRLGNLFEDRTGRIWITSECGLYLFNKETKSFDRRLNRPGDSRRLDNQIVYSIMEDRPGNLWITTFDGIYKYNHELRLLYHWQNQITYPHSISYETSYGILYEDNAGTIWTCTRDGIYKLIKEHENFTVINPDPPRSNENRSVYLINEDSIFYGTTAGNYYAFNWKKAIYKEYNLSSTRIMFEDSHGIFWIGTSHGLFRRVVKDDQTIEHIGYQQVPGDSSSLQGTEVETIFEDSEGRLWIGCRLASPCYYDRENDCFIHLVNKPNSPYNLTRIEYICHETDSKALIARSRGAYKIIPPFSKISEFAITANDIIEIVPQKPTPQDSSHLYVSCLDRRGNLWLGDMNMGLFKWVDDDFSGIHSEGKWTLYTTMDGLPGNWIMRIEEDLNGKLWIGTTTGLSKFNPHYETFTNFYEQNGLPSNCFLKSSAKSPKGELFLGTGAGVVSFHPDSIQLNSTIPAVRLTSLKIHNQEIIPGENSLLRNSIQFTDAIKLSHDQNTLTLGFAVLNYIQPERNRYKYTLEGLEDEWVFSGLRNNVTYANLKSGTYTFRATGSNNDGIWNEEGVALTITIKAPPWLSWWAYLCYVVLLVGIIMLVRRYQVSRVNMKTALLEERIGHEKVRELDHLKSQFFANISHEFRTPLTMILGPIEKHLNKRGKDEGIKRYDLGIIHRNAKRLQQLINQLLDISKLESGKVKLQVSEGNLTEFISRVVYSFYSLAESKGIKYEYDQPDIPGPFYFDGDKLDKIITNLASNAFKFTPPEGKIKVKLNYIMEKGRDVPAFAEISIQDTGKGIPSDQFEKIFDRFYQVGASYTRDYEGTGIGLSLTKELVDIYRGQIYVESEQDKGSKFVVVLPISKEQFKEDELIPSGTTDKNEIESPSGFNIEDSSAENEIIAGHHADLDSEEPVILIVEDNTDLRKYISGILHNDCRVLEAENGRIGLIRTIEEIPDLVITDLMMPEMDGIELCNRIRKDQRTDHIPIVMLTARADKESKLKGLATGADDYLIKPFDADMLQVRVSNLILQRKKLREKYLREFAENDPFTKDIPTQNNDFLTRVVECILENLEDHEFGVEQLANNIGFSRSQLQRKIRSLTGYVPNKLIRNIRLKQAARMFHEGNTNITEVLYMVGFNTPSHFSKCFRDYFGINPSDYLTQSGFR